MTAAHDVGADDAFQALVDAHRAELRAHCYRMLGSVHDADDALQETFLRAWRGLAKFEGRASVRSWLYAIASNAAMDIARHRSRRELPTDFAEASSAGSSLQPPLTDLPWLEPYPDSWLADDAGQSPDARYEQRESIELAFMVALQHLPPLQRAVLLLRDVVGLSTAEICVQLRKTPAAVNSALQRAREAARDRLPSRSQQATARMLGDDRVRSIVEQYASAIERADIDTLVSMLTEDAAWSMPPTPSWFRGLEAVRDFLVRFPLAERWQHVPTLANGQLAVGCYLFSPATDDYRPAVLDVLTLAGEQIAAVTGFQCAEVLGPPPRRPGDWIAGAELFTRFNLPLAVAAPVPT